MIRPAPLALLAVAALGGAARANDFQGRAEYRLSADGGERGTAVALLGPGGARFEVSFRPPSAAADSPEVKVSTLIRSEDHGHVYFIDEAHHSYSVIDSEGGEATGKWKVTRLGAATVAGYPCARARVEAEGEERVEACISTSLGRIPAWASAEGDSGLPAALAAAGLDGLPLRWNREGGKGTALELVKLSRERPPASAFEVPAGYARRERPGPMTLSPEARTRLQERMKSLSPEQRKRLEDMLKGQGSGAE